MSLRKLSIILSIVLLIFISSINTASAFEVPNSNSYSSEFSKKLDYLDNSMYILIKSISADKFDTNDVNKQISFLNSLITDITNKSYDLPKEQRDIAAALQAISSFYKLAVIKAENYVNSKNSDDLISAISTFSIGYTSSINLRNLVFGAGK
ncbi:hypothetical protein C672_2006 [[Clostridium] bifermentans ATCC 638]|uniref:Uncharacterized protein n=1 Tax=Paraclostridium bifermentans ATCC 638 = DSM 14991 TaxID=1233171 RepID=T4VQU2_PARBF|nr:hypothetical protein [Paraclostridium bifermentans]EQK43062.1 hypothetical protein C672_2006 [[Clostridium] bifermentans ATCC 638] [Paraclostridium bifermentans ATCC 638 = DSM 14991]RIZ60294.1 hypothetical protein CHH45_00570 [Paraclostridium bifermentans]UAG16936.1 hypothetical protein KXZ80_09055 [Paraclostridium bifermentans]